jgi:poly(hydroxyalkanoate) granule-associated protein
MANKKVQRSKAQATKLPADAGSIWLAGVGALSLARRHGEARLGDMVKEGRRLQGEVAKFVRKSRVDARSRISGMLTPVQAQLQSAAKLATAAAESGLAGMRARLGIPSKADIDELSQRIGALSRQLKAAGK